jgi:hypothetical protein
VEASIVRKLARLGDPSVEGLVAIAARRPAMSLEQLPPSVSQGDHHRA